MKSIILYYNIIFIKKILYNWLLINNIKIFKKYKKELNDMKNRFNDLSKEINTIKQGK